MCATLPQVPRGNKVKAYILDLHVEGQFDFCLPWGQMAQNQHGKKSSMAQKQISPAGYKRGKIQSVISSLPCKPLIALHRLTMETGNEV
jgi:hypothetical protein